MRTRQVFPTDKLAHLWIYGECYTYTTTRTWAERRHYTDVRRARNAQSNFSFDGATLYSYRHGIARCFSADTGKATAPSQCGSATRVIVVGSNYDSATTRSHISRVEMAVPSNTVSYCLISLPRRYGRYDAGSSPSEFRTLYDVAQWLIKELRKQLAIMATPNWRRSWRSQPTALREYNRLRLLAESLNMAVDKVYVSIDALLHEAGLEADTLIQWELEAQRAYAVASRAASNRDTYFGRRSWHRRYADPYLSGANTAPVRTLAEQVSEWLTDGKYMTRNYGELVRVPTEGVIRTTQGVDMPISLLQRYWTALHVRGEVPDMVGPYAVHRAVAGDMSSLVIGCHTFGVLGTTSIGLALGLLSNELLDSAIACVAKNFADNASVASDVAEALAVMLEQYGRQTAADSVRSIASEAREALNA